MQKRIARNARAQMRPLSRMIHQFIAARVVEEVETGFFKRAAPPVFLPQHAVVRLFLQFKLHAACRTPRQFPSQMFAEEFHGVALVAVHAQAHPEQVQMVRHQDIYRAEQAFACGGVKQQFAEMEMERVVQPASGASL